MTAVATSSQFQWNLLVQNAMLLLDYGYFYKLTSLLLFTAASAISELESQCCVEIVKASIFSKSYQTFWNINPTKSRLFLRDDLRSVELQHKPCVLKTVDEVCQFDQISNHLHRQHSLFGQDGATQDYSSERGSPVLKRPSAHRDVQVQTPRESILCLKSDLLPICASFLHPPHKTLSFLKSRKWFTEKRLSKSDAECHLSWAKRWKKNKNSFNELFWINLHHIIMALKPQIKPWLWNPLWRREDLWGGWGSHEQRCLRFHISVSCVSVVSRYALIQQTGKVKLSKAFSHPANLLLRGDQCTYWLFVLNR